MDLTYSNDRKHFLPKKLQQMIDDGNKWFIKSDSTFTPNKEFIRLVVKHLWSLPDSEFRTHGKQQKKTTTIAIDYKLTTIAWMAFQFATNMNGKQSDAQKITLCLPASYNGMKDILATYYQCMIPWTDKTEVKYWIGNIIGSKWQRRYVDMRRANGQGVHPKCPHYRCFELLGICGHQIDPNDVEHMEDIDDNEDDQDSNQDEDKNDDESEDDGNDGNNTNDDNDDPDSDDDDFDPDKDDKLSSDSSTNN